MLATQLLAYIVVSILFIGFVFIWAHYKDKQDQSAENTERNSKESEI